MSHKLPRIIGYRHILRFLLYVINFARDFSAFRRENNLNRAQERILSDYYGYPGEFFDDYRIDDDPDDIQPYSETAHRYPEDTDDIPF